MKVLPLVGRADPCSEVRGQTWLLSKDSPKKKNVQRLARNGELVTHLAVLPSLVGGVLKPIANKISAVTAQQIAEKVSLALFWPMSGGKIRCYFSPGFTLLLL